MRKLLCCAALAAVAVFTSRAWADPFGDQVLKFQQLPLNGGQPLPTPYAGPYFNPNPFPPPPSGLPLQPFAAFPGHDELSTAVATQWDALQNPTMYSGTFMADDFADRFASPIVHLRWWGSYLNNLPANGVQKFLITVESDVPAGGTELFSHPGVPLLSQVVTRGLVTPGSGTFSEMPVPSTTGPDGTLYQYNAELHFDKQFQQQPDTVYWLKIVALLDPQKEPTYQWGWHDRDYLIPDYLASVPPAVAPGEGTVGIDPATGLPVWHFQDDAVSGAVTLIDNGTVLDVIQMEFLPQHCLNLIDGEIGIDQFSKDLAFEIYTIPEPGALAILLAVCPMLLARRKQ